MNAWMCTISNSEKVPDFGKIKVFRKKKIYVPSIASRKLSGFFLEVAEYIPCVCRFEQQEMQKCSLVSELLSLSSHRSLALS